MDSSRRGFSRKFSKLQIKATRTKTDTGSRGENPKVLELFTAKELGKIDL